MPLPTVARVSDKNLGNALRHRRFLLGRWPWRAFAYVLGTPLLVIVAAVPVGALSAPVMATFSPGMSGSSRAALFVVGLVVLFLGLPWVARPLARVERRRLRLVDPDTRDRPSPRGYRDPATWLEVGYTALLVTVGTVVYGGAFLLAGLPLVFLSAPLVLEMTNGPIALGFTPIVTVEDALGYAAIGLVLLPFVPYAAGLLAAGHAAVARSLLLGDLELVEVTRSRARLVDSFDAERRRIERDLHDGAQEKLVSLTLRLGMARLDVPEDSPAHRNVVAAHEQAKQLMADLRELVRGIHPKVLADRGLVAALEDLAGRSPVPVAVTADVRRLPSHLESTAYFVVAEALTNVARHSGADSATVTAAERDGSLVVEVADDGRGGAVPGGGLAGLADRVAVVDGRMALSSPVGGPTLLRVELPCHRSE